MSTVPESAQGKSITIYVDADACPVKHEVYRVAARHRIKVVIVANSPIAVPRDPLIERVVVSAGMDKADDWIAERIGRGDMLVTADVPLASRGVKAGATVLAPNGKAFTDDFDRHGAGDPQPHGCATQRRGDDCRAEVLFAARPFGIPLSLGPGDRALKT